jgi:hypothetical protein
MLDLPIRNYLFEQSKIKARQREEAKAVRIKPSARAALPAAKQPAEQVVEVVTEQCVEAPVVQEDNS